VRKRLLVITGVLLAIWAVSAVVLGAPDEKERRTVSGEIAAIDAKAQTMTLKNDMSGGVVMEFDLDPGITVRMHGLRGRVEQLKFGDYVMVRYVERDNRYVAMEIHLG